MILLEDECGLPDEFIEPMDFNDEQPIDLASRRRALEFERDSLAVENLSLDIKDERRKLNERRWSDFWAGIFG